jgi:5-methyltetrahydrofolate--homocysteine methyltransferase
MRKIKDKLKEGKVILSDGSWGTFLGEKGLTMNDCPELWNKTHRDIVLEVPQEYIAAGSEMVETNSFGGNKIKLEQYGLGNETYDLNKMAAEISREAAGEKIIVLGSIGPTGKLLMTGEITEAELYEAFKLQVEGLRDGGVDAFCIETFFDLDEALIALKAVRENSDLEAAITFTFDNKGGAFYTMMGVTPAQMAEKLLEAEVDVFGTNCGNGFEGMIDIVREIRTVDKEFPVLVHANAGLPIMENGKVVYPDSPERMAALTPALVEAGANIIGGCCGTNPEHIKAIKKELDKINSGNSK